MNRFYNRQIELNVVNALLFERMKKSVHARLATVNESMISYFF